MHQLRLVQPACETCGLDGGVKVWGRGPEQADLVVIGEAPGANEVRQLTPFVGDSGQLLKTVMRAVGLNPDEAFFTNVCLCRPPGNRQPSKHEAECCSARLESEVLSRNPRKILLLGTTATQALLGKKVQTVRGTYAKWHGIDVLSTFHPAAILRNPEAFRDFANDLQKLQRDPYPLVTPEYRVFQNTVQTLAALDELAKRGRPVSLDIETSSYSPYKDKFLCVGLSDDPLIAYIIEDHLMQDPLVARRLERLSNEVSIVCHNGAFEYRWLKVKFGIKLHVSFDTMLAHHCLDERSAESELGRASHDLKTLGGYYFDLPNWEDEFKKHIERDDYSTAPKDVLYKYLAMDLSTTLRLEEVLEKDLREDDCWEVFQSVIMPALGPLAEMSVRGIMVDWKYLCGDLDTLLRTKIARRKRRLEIVLGKPEGWLNTRSHKKMSELFYDELRLPTLRGKGRGTGKKVIKELEQKTGNKRVRQIGNLRRAEAMLSTFCEGLQELIQDDGRIHTMYLQHGTDTGRLASRNPNMQNIPNHFGYGKIIRDSFIATPGYEFLDVDYKQLEFRTAAVVTGDKTLIEFVKTGRDIHAEQASMYFNVPISQVTEDMRHDSKRVVFGVFFRRGPYSVSREYDIPLPEARRRFQILYDTCPGILTFFDDVDQTIREQGEVVSLFGRKRRFPFLTRDNAEEAGRQAANHPIQATATDINLCSNVRIAPQLEPEEARWLLTIHDGDLYEIRSDKFDEIARLIVAEKEKDPPFDTKGVKFKVSCKRGTRWGSLRKYDVPS